MATYDDAMDSYDDVFTYSYGEGMVRKQAAREGWQGGSTLNAIHFLCLRGITFNDVLRRSE